MLALVAYSGKQIQWNQQLGAHTAGWKAAMPHSYGEKENVTCVSLMSYSNYSDQLIFCINTQDSRVVVLLNRLDANKNLRRFAVTTFPQGLMNKAPEILFSCITHWCCFCGFVLQINQSGHQVQVLTKINVRNNVLCIGHSVGFCREHTYKQTTFRLRVWTDGWVEKPCVKQCIKKKEFYEANA